MMIRLLAHIFKTNNLLIFSSNLDHYIGTSFELEFRNDNHSFLQNNTIELTPSFSFNKKDANTFNFLESDFNNNSHPSFAEVSKTTINNDLLFDGDKVNSSIPDDDNDFFLFLKFFFY